jgi:ubiquinone/menaquinone biosynthesis C-methylase UbiE
MFQPSASVSPQSSPYVEDSIAPPGKTVFVADRPANILVRGIQRRWRRYRRRRKVGRAYDMALEIAAVVPRNARVLDVGCGNGFIAHHLNAMLGTNVVGIDLDATTEAAIDYRQFDGQHFPVADGSIDAVLLCYVLHHTQRLDVVMNELRRVVSNNGLAVIYEDIPSVWWDRFVCWAHNLKWEKRTGKCVFRSDFEWTTLLISAGFDIVTERPLSRWRNLTHPVRRKFFLARFSESYRIKERR